MTAIDQRFIRQTPGADQKFAREGLTFDDVALVPGRSSVLPSQVATTTRLAGSISLQIPVISAAMDTVTEARLAIAIAREGGIGIVHRNLSIQAQALEIDTVKRSQSGMIVDPITLGPAARLFEAVALMERYHISGVPITEDGKLVGILTNRDIRFRTEFDQAIGDLMTREGLITVPLGTTLEEAKNILHQHRIEKLPVVDEEGRLRGLITVKDIQKQIEFPNVDCGSGQPSAWATTPKSEQRSWCETASTYSSSIPRTGTRKT